MRRAPHLRKEPDVHTLHSLTTVVHDSPEELGLAVARRAAEVINSAVSERGEARVMLAAAPSQLPTLAALAQQDVDFDCVEFFHMDDYLGLDRDAPQGFGNWLEANFLSQIPGRPHFHRIDSSLEPDTAVRTYADVMGTEPFDVTLCGLGVNAHLAFNDPPADFEDPQSARWVELDQVSRQQQVDEGHFPSLESVPTHAITVTIPRLLNAQVVLCSVLGDAKREAVRNTRDGDLDPLIPGTALKLHPAAELHVDPAAVADE